MSTSALTNTSQVRASTQSPLPSSTNNSTDTGKGGLSGAAEKGAIAGGTVGGLALVLFLAIGSFILYRRRRASRPVTRPASPETAEPPRRLPPVYQSGLNTGSNFGIRENE